MALRVPTQKESLAFTMTGGFHPLFTFILAAPDGSLLFYMAPSLWRSLWITLTHQFFFFFEAALSFSNIPRMSGLPHFTDGGSRFSENK